MFGFLAHRRSPLRSPIAGWGVGEWHKFLSEVVRLADRKAYFNAGVLVMDLKRFRNTGLIQAAEEFLEQTNYKTVYVDQDALNHVITVHLSGWIHAGTSLAIAAKPTVTTRTAKTRPRPL